MPLVRSPVTRVDPACLAPHIPQDGADNAAPLRSRIRAYPAEFNAVPLHTTYSRMPKQ